MQSQVVIVIILAIIVAVTLTTVFTLRSRRTLGAKQYVKILKDLPCVTPEQCLSEQNSDVDELFDRHLCRTIVTKFDTLISISLFEIPQKRSAEEKTAWNQKYYQTLVKNFKWVQDQPINVALYTTQNLYEQLMNDDQVPFSDYKFVEVYIMKHNTITTQPGTLWRFLSLQDQRFATVNVCDIDENWTWVLPTAKKLTQQRHAVLATLRSKDVDVSEHVGLGVRERINQKNRAFIIASHVSVKPTRFFPPDLSIEQVIEGFIALSHKNKLGWSPFSKYQNWGRDYLDYGSDEYFLKRVVFHTAVRMGDIQLN